MKPSLVRSASLLVLLAAAVSASAANLIVDGGFESGNLGHWSPTGTASLFGPGANSSTAVYVFEDELGNASGTIGQTVATVIGKSYTLSFDYLLEDIGGGYTGGISVDVNGQFVAGVGTPTSGSSPLNYAHLDYAFTADSDRTAILFNLSTNQAYVAVDNVSLVGPSPTPGPAAALPFALMALRRRKRA